MRLRAGPRLAVMAAVMLALTGVAQAQMGGSAKGGGDAAPGKASQAAPPPAAPPPVAPAAAPTEQCPDNAAAYAGSSESFACLCPAEATGNGSVWGSDVYTADSGLCRAALHAGLVGRRGGPVTVQMMPGQPRYLGVTRNGVQSQNYGAYDTSFRFEGGRPVAEANAGPQDLGQCPDNLASFAGEAGKLTCSCAPGQSGNGSVWGSDTYTADSATCRAALHAGAIGRNGGPVMVQMLPGQPRYVGLTRNGVQSQNYGNYDSSYRFDGPGGAAAAPAQQGGPTRMAQCPDNMTAFANSDETVVCGCAAVDVARSAAIWGSDTYTADSATCRAALHAGAVGRQGGEVTVQMLPGQPRYLGVTRNGVQSQNYGAYDSSFRFGRAGGQAAAPAGAAAAASATPALCPDNLMSYAGSDETITCLCPGEATTRGSVWGTDTYTSDSGTCRAAVHAGVIGLGGGTVTARMLPAQQRYPGTTRNGIQSQNYGAYDSSFRFQGGQRAQGSVPLQAPVAETLRTSGQVQLYVTFRTGSADLDIAAAPVLMQVRDAMLADPGLRLRLVGHTDNQGSAQTNVPLSIRRAEAVRAWLAQNGVAPDRLATEGRGQTEPIADNGSEPGRALNRRVQAVRVQ